MLSVISYFLTIKYKLHFIDSKMIFFCILMYQKLGCVLQLIASHGLIGIAVKIFFPLYTK